MSSAYHNEEEYATTSVFQYAEWMGYNRRIFQTNVSMHALPLPCGSAGRLIFRMHARGVDWNDVCATHNASLFYFFLLLPLTYPWAKWACSACSVDDNPCTVPAVALV